MIAYRSTPLGWLLLGMLLCVAGDAFGQWSQFRGPNGSGVDPAVGYPVAFSPTHNVVWKAAVPYGQSSPVVAGRHVYVTASDGEVPTPLTRNTNSRKDADAYVHQLVKRAED